MARRRTALLAACFALSYAAPARSEGDASPDLSLLYRRKSVLVHTRQDRWFEGKAFATYGDSLVFVRGGDSVRLAGADIDGAWRTHSAPLRQGMIHGVTGFVGGAFLEIALGTDCDCPVDVGQTLKGAFLGGALDAASGAFFGLFGGGWKQIVPDVEGGEAAQPFRTWTGSTGFGWLHPGAAFDDTGPVQGRIARWSAGPTNFAMGVEYGSLSGWRSIYERSNIPPDSMGNGGGNSSRSEHRTRFAYVSTQLRWRRQAGSAHPQVTLGVGTYFRRDSGTYVRRDSTGAVLMSSSGFSTDQDLGFNVGAGVTFGRSAVRPGIDARMHFLLGDMRGSLFTLGAFADWR